MALRPKETFVKMPEIDSEEIRKSAIDHIEEITLHIIEEIHSKKFPKVTYYDFNKKRGSKSVEKETPDQQFSQTNFLTSFDSSRSLSWVHEDEKIRHDESEAGDVPVNEERAEAVIESVKSVKNSTTVDFRNKRSRKNLVLIITVMSHVHKMLINDTTRTRRSLYYELQREPTAGLAKTQRVLDDAVNHVASLLERAPWELGFTATSKGLVCGDLTLTFSGHDSVNCNVPGGFLIPQNIFRVTAARTTAKYILVVEKDTIFQKLLLENCIENLNFVLVTGKGYPDVNTRMLVHVLGEKLKIPVYVLVDSDPFGIEIMCIYRFGSAMRSREQRNLVCPIARWIGVHPSEYSRIGVSPRVLSNADKARLASIQGRAYIDENLSREIEAMWKKGKVDIEAVAGLSYGFLTNIYVRNKIAAGEFV